MFEDCPTIIVAPVSINCNLRCRYCFHRDGQAEGKGSGRMSRETLENLTAQAAELSHRVRFIWHGGEPTLAGRDFYADVMQVQSAYSDIVFRNNIQTNGVLLNSNWLDFFREYGFRVGISLDGPPEVHDRQRIYPDGQGTFVDVCRVALEANEKLPRSGVLGVITKHSLGMATEIFNFLTDRFSSFDLLPYYETNLAVRESNNLTISPDEYANFMTEIFDLWLERDDPEIKIRTLQQWVRGVVGLSPTLCRFNGSCANYISIDANGDVYPCDRFNGEMALCFGNLHQSPLSKILTGEQYAQFKIVTKDVVGECLECCWWEICHGDCTHYRYQGEGKFGKQSYFCLAQKRVLAHIHDRVGEIVTAIKQEIPADVENEWG